MERIPIISDPVLFDKAVADMQRELGDKISWLDHIFGICERVTRVIDGVKYNTANIYTGGNDYMQIEPCFKLGNFCFFYLRDPQTFDSVNDSRVQTPISVIFWYDMRQVSSSPSGRNREAVKAEVLSVLKEAHLPNGTFIWSRLYEEPKNVFADFSYEHIDNQFLMSPYAGFRIDATLYADIPCYEPAPDDGDDDDDDDDDGNNVA